MKRKDFIKKSILGAIGLPLVASEVAKAEPLDFSNPVPLNYRTPDYHPKVTIMDIFPESAGEPVFELVITPLDIEGALNRKK